MSPDREAELRERIRSDPKLQAELRQRIRVFLQWSLVNVFRATVRFQAEIKAKPYFDEPDLWPPLVENCEKDRWTWETLSALVRFYRERGRERGEAFYMLPAPLSEWTVDVAAGDLERPKWSTRPKVSAGRDLNLAIAVARLHVLGHPYAPPSKDSGCELVAEWTSMGIGTVRDIWFKQRKNIRKVWSAMEDPLFCPEFPRPSSD